MPLVRFTVAVPELVHPALVVVVVKDKLEDALIVVDVVAVQPPVPVTVTVYVPGPILEMVCVVPLLLQA